MDCLFKSGIQELQISLGMHNSKHRMRNNAEGYGCRTR